MSAPAKSAPTPSEQVMLAPDLFAPPPPIGNAAIARIRFEAEHAWGPLVGVFVGSALMFATATDSAGNPDAEPWKTKAIGAIIAVASFVAWYLVRRSKDPEVDRPGLDISRPLGGRRLALTHELTVTTLATAILANVEAGLVTLETDDDGILWCMPVTRPAGAVSPWPEDSLEDSLWRARRVPLIDLVADWLAGLSNFPASRATRIIEHLLVRRGWCRASVAGGTTLSSAGAVIAAHPNVEQAETLLASWRAHRAPIWSALVAAIEAAFSATIVPPTYEQRGQVAIPKYDYREAPIESLDRGAAGEARPERRGAEAFLAPELIAHVTAAAPPKAVSSTGAPSDPRRDVRGDARTAHDASDLWSLTEATALPPFSDAASERLLGWEERTLAIASRYRWAFWSFVAGYIAIVLGFWWSTHGGPSGGTENTGPANTPVFLFFLSFLTIFIALWNWVNGAKGKAAIQRAQADDELPDHSSLALALPIYRVIALVYGWTLFEPQDEVRSAFRVALIGFVLLHLVFWHWRIAEVRRRLPALGALRMTMMRVFGSPSFDDLKTFVAPWLRAGVIEHLDGFDSLTEKPEVREAVKRGRLQDVIIKDGTALDAALAKAQPTLDDKLMYQRYSFQCADTTWRDAITRMLDRSDVVLMDLSSLSPENAGCAWELQTLLARVPLDRVVLLVNDSTDLATLQGILTEATRTMPATSPNVGAAHGPWRLVRIGGLSMRLADESYVEWRRRIDVRLDPLSLTAHLVDTALPPRHRSVPDHGAVARWAHGAIIGAMLAPAQAVTPSA